MELSQVINLDIGGKRFRILRSTIMKYPNSLLAKVITGRDTNNMIIFDGAYFFDRNPKYFSIILDYMRIGKLYLPPGLLQDQLDEELSFWQVLSTHSQAQLQPKQDEPTLIIPDLYEPTMIIPDYIEPTVLAQSIPDQTIQNPSLKIEPTLLVEDPLPATSSPVKRQTKELKIEQMVLTKSVKIKQEALNPEEDDLLCSLVQEKPPEKPKTRTLPWGKSQDLKKEENVKKEEKSKKEEEKKKGKNETKTGSKEDYKNKGKVLKKSKDKSESGSLESSFIDDDAVSNGSKDYMPKKRSTKAAPKKTVKKNKCKQSELLSEEELLKALSNFKS